MKDSKLHAEWIKNTTPAEREEERRKIRKDQEEATKADEAMRALGYNDLSEIWTKDPP